MKSSTALVLFCHPSTEPFRHNVPRGTFPRFAQMFHVEHYDDLPRICVMFHVEHFSSCFLDPGADRANVPRGTLLRNQLCGKLSTNRTQCTSDSTECTISMAALKSGIALAIHSAYSAIISGFFRKLKWDA